MKYRIVAIDDSPIVLSLVKGELEGAGYDVTTTTDGGGLHALLSRVRPHLVLMDVNMPLLPGDRLASLTVRLQTCPVLFHSDRPDTELEALVRRVGVAGYVRKLPRCAGLVLAVQAALIRAGAPPKSNPPKAKVGR